MMRMSARARSVVMRCAAVCALVVAACAPVAAADADAVGILPDAVLQFVSSASSPAALDGTQLFVTSAGFGPAPATSARSYTLMVPGGSDPFACTVNDLPPLSASITPPPALLIPRGNCPYITKVMNAAAAGASAVVVYDSLAAVYASQNASTLLPAADSCHYDCTAGSGSVPVHNATYADALTGFPGQCGGSSCASGLCALTPASSTSGSVPPTVRQLCCAVSDALVMGAATAATPALTNVVSVFATLEQGAKLAAYMGAPLTTLSPAARQRALVAQGTAVVTLAERAVPGFDVGGALLWATAVLVVGGATLVATRADRRVAGARREHTPAASEDVQASQASRVDMSARQAVVLVLAAAAMLIVLYVLINSGVRVIWLLYAVFTLPAFSALMSLLFLPLLLKFAPKLHDRTLVRSTRRAFTFTVTAADVVAAAAAIGLLALWLVYRNAPGGFILHDAIAACVCALLLSTLRLRHLRDAALLLGIFFVYDVFMVFVTPLFFNSSVMIDVATAGGLTPVDNWACYCRKNPQDSASCGVAEVMPFLLRMPHFGDYRGGFAMLGLGDIVLPGFLLVLAAAKDAQASVHEGAPASRAAMVCTNANRLSYWAAAMLGYAVGLVAAFVVVMFTSTGQPALLYLCPAVFFPVYWLASRRGELDEWWMARPRTVNTDAATAGMTGDAEVAPPAGGDAHLLSGGGGGGDDASSPPRGDAGFDVEGDEEDVDDESARMLPSRRATTGTSSVRGAARAARELEMRPVRSAAAVSPEHVTVVTGMPAQPVYDNTGAAAAATASSAAAPPPAHSDFVNVDLYDAAPVHADDDAASDTLTPQRQVR